MTALLAPEPRPKVLSIMPTYQCTAACRDCGTFSSSSPRHASLEGDTVTRLIAEAAAAGYRGVVFTGGEATLALDIVLAGVAQAKAFGMGTRLVTNGWWANTDASAEDVLRRKALSLGLRSLCVMVEVTNTSTIRKEQILENEQFQRAYAHDGAAHVLVFESPWMPIRPDRRHSYPDGYLLNRINVALKSGCSSCLTTTWLSQSPRIMTLRSEPGSRIHFRKFLPQISAGC